MSPQPRRYRIANTLFWLAVILGLLPFLLAAIPFSSFNCSGYNSELQLFCEMGIQRSHSFLTRSNVLLYSIAFIFAVPAAIICRYWFKFLALTPLLILLLTSLYGWAPTTPRLQSFIYKPMARVQKPKVKPATVSKMKSTSVKKSNVINNNNGLTQVRPVLFATVIQNSSATKNRPLLDQHVRHIGAETNKTKPNGNKPDNKPGHNRPRHEIDNFKAPGNNTMFEAPPIKKITRAGWFYKQLWPLYGLCTLFSLFLFFSANRIRSGTFFVIPLSMTSLIVLDNLSSGALGLLYSLYPVLLLMIIAVVVRLLVLVVMQNTDIVAGMGFVNTLVNSIKTLLRWWVIAGIATVGLYYSSLSEEIATEAVYCIGTVTDTNPGCSHGKGLITDFSQHSTLEEDINASIDQRFAKVEATINVRINRALADANGSGKAAAKNLMDEAYDGPKPIFKKKLWQYDKSLKPTDKGCSWFWPDFKCMAIKSIKIAINEAWEEARARQKARLKRELVIMSSSGEKDLKKNLQAVKSRFSRDLKELSFSIKKTIGTAFLAFRVIDLIAKLLLIITLIKSFAYIFARFAFSQKRQAYLPMAKNTASNEIFENRLTLSNKGSNYNFPAHQTTGFYVSRKFDVSGVPASLACPKPWQAAGRRLTNNLMWMNWLRPAADESPSIQTSQGAEFVEWQVEAGEQIYLNPENLVAYSKGMKLRTEISMRMTSLVFGRLSFLTITGPGTLVLKTFGKAALFPAETQAKSFSAPRFVAWSAASQVAVSSQTGLWNIYFSGIQVALEPNSRCVVDVAPDGAASGGALGFIPACLLPI